MTTYYLINSVTMPFGLLLPGTLINDASESVANIQAAGGALVVSTNATVAAAASVAQAIAKSAGDVAQMEAVMQAAYTAAVDTRSESIGTAEIVDLAVTAAKIAADAVTTAKILNANVTTAKLADAAVTAAKLANGAGVAALLTAGLGASAVVDHGDASPVSLLAADATNNRAVLVVAICTETLAGDTPPTFDVGWTADADGIIDATVLAGATAGDVFIGAGNVPSTNAVRATVTAGSGGTPAGAFSFVVLALPESA